MRKYILITAYMFLSFNTGLLQERSGNRFLTFSDVHFDPYYDTTLIDELINADYTEWESIFIKSKIKSYSQYGSDTDYPLFISSMEEMKLRIPGPDFIIITGDFMGHNFNEEFEQYSGSSNTDTLNSFIEKTIRFVTSVINRYYPETTIFPSVGNDDSYCGNYMIEPEGAFLKMVSEVWEPLVNKNGKNKSFQQTFSKGGYSILNFPESESNKIIILNTIFFTTYYKNQCGDTLQDPGNEELQWLRRTLKECKENNHKVWLSYHVPPGIDIYGTIHGKGNCEEKIFTTWKKKYNEEFLKIILEYSPIINSTLAGHFHRDDFRIFFNEGNPVSYIHLTPSISPVYGNNPAYQIIQYDSSKYELLNYETYYLKNLSVADSAYWSMEYDFQKIYNQSSITSSTLNNISQLIYSDSIYRAEYISYYTAGDQITYGSDYSTWYYNWCGFANLTKEDYLKCLCEDSTTIKK